MDDVVDGDDPTVRDRKRADVYERWLVLAREDDFVGVQNYERIHYDGDGAVPVPDGVPRNQMGTAIEPQSLAGAVRYAHEVTGVPVLVTEHGMAHDDDTQRAGVHRARPGGPARRDRGRRAGARLLPLDAARQLRVDLRLRLPATACTRSTGRRSSGPPKPSAGVYAAIAKAGAVQA